MSDSQNDTLQNAAVQHNGQVGGSQRPENLQNVEVDDYSSKSIGPLSKGSVKEATSHQSGIQGHLQFEAKLAGEGGIPTVNSHISHDATKESDNSTLPASLRDWESLIPPDVELREVSSSREATSGSQNVASRLSFCQPEFVRSSQHDGSLPITGPFPSGFGLHLMPIAKSMSMSSDLVPSKTLPGEMSSQEDKLTPEDINHFEKDSNSCLISTVAGKIHAHMDNDLQDDQAVAGGSSVTYQDHDSMKLLCGSLQVTLSEQQSAPCESMMLTSEKTDRFEELKQISPKEKRKKATYNSETEDSKQCNCKSSCSKLYCECFGAGVYCTDSCACESCYDKRGHEDTVNDLRQQFESCNPFAYAPTIVNQATDSPENVKAAPFKGKVLTSENTDRVEKSKQVSPKEKREKATYNSQSDLRCNCKESTCLKLSCECFGAGFYCADPCTCESCYNNSEYEELVEDAREDIESCDPLAFPPEIVDYDTESSSNVEEIGNSTTLQEVGNLTTPPSARHERGCNCKKSKCLKRYCKCFQANVGCSDECRCKRCRNSYGKRTAYDRKRKDNIPETQKDTSTPTDAS